MPTCKLCPPGTKGCSHCCTSAHLFVGQQPYLSELQAPTGMTFEPRITFRKGEKCGIPVKDGILNNFRGLKDHGRRPFYGADGIADQPALRIEWPGYPSWSTTFRTRDHTSARTPVSLSQLVNDICKSIERFINVMEMRECTDPIWRVGPGYLDVNHLVLVSLQRASDGAWVTSIRLTDVEMPERRNVI